MTDKDIYSSEGYTVCYPSSGQICPKSDSAYFCTMIKRAVRDLHPCGLSTKRGISRYIDLRYGLQNDCLLNSTLKWMVCCGVLRRKCGQYAFCCSSKLVKEEVISPADKNKCKTRARSRKRSCGIKRRRRRKRSNVCDPCCQPIRCQPKKKCCCVRCCCEKSTRRKRRRTRRSLKCKRTKKRHGKSKSCGQYVKLRTWYEKRNGCLYKKEEFI